MEYPQEIKLSFIVPIYNVKPYLKKCVDSLLHQDYDNYEIILVDDGSTDGSGELADEIKGIYDNSRDIYGNLRFITVLHQANRGLSGARNAGIELAQGKYICFVDSDDYWEDNVLGGLMAQIERDNLDVLRFRWQHVKIRQEAKGEEARNEYEVFQPYKAANFANFSSVVRCGSDFLNLCMGIQCYAWSFILRKSLLTPALSPRREEGACLISPDSSLVERGGDYPLNHTQNTSMRIGSTEAENALWQMLRGKQIGYKFRRQHPIGEFIADFICLEAQLIVEADGGYHLTPEQQEEDARRTRILNEKGYHIVRFTNDQILCDPDTTLSRIRAKLQERLDAKKRGEWRSSFPTGERGEDKEGKEACLFTEGMLFEDTDWTPRMLVRANRVAGSETVVYNYLWRESGITLSRGMDKVKKEVDNKIALIAQFAEYGEYPWYKTMVSALSVNVISILSGALYNERYEYLKSLTKTGVFPISLGRLNKRTRRKARIINICPALAVWMMHIKNK